MVAFEGGSQLSHWTLSPLSVSLIGLNSEL